MDKKLVVHDLAVMAASKHFADRVDSSDFISTEEIGNVYTEYVCRIAPSFGVDAAWILKESRN